MPLVATSAVMFVLGAGFCDKLVIPIATGRFFEYPLEDSGPDAHVEPCRQQRERLEKELAADQTSEARAGGRGPRRWTSAAICCVLRLRSVAVQRTTDG